MSSTPSKEALIKKYDVPVPRYTSYPPVPSWGQVPPSHDLWLQRVKQVFDETNTSKGISLYIHLPFCESLCTYCGCNKRITTNHSVEEKYIQALLAEWQQYLDYMKQPPLIRELHLGGGTPTFFSARNLQLLLEGILSPCAQHPNFDFGFEGHPNNTTWAHLQTLYDQGFRRVSFGVQDLDIEVQKVINRIQPFEKVVAATSAARHIGYRSINFDLIFGLPRQTKSSIDHTMVGMDRLRPDRIAFYSYAHVPWKAPSQRGYDLSDLPHAETKRELYEFGRERLLNLGYVEIGMDHFALPHDPLAVAFRDQTLHRNFMGYTTCHTDLLIGLGMSAISDARTAYVQNLKQVEAYQDGVNQGSLALEKGYCLTHADQIIRDFITALICQGQAELTPEITETMNQPAWHQLYTMEQEGLLRLNNDRILIRPLGGIFIRNICQVFDRRSSVSRSTQQFSKTI